MCAELTPTGGKPAWIIELLIEHFIRCCTYLLPHCVSLDQLPSVWNQSDWVTQHDDNRDVNTNPRHHHILPSDVTLINKQTRLLFFIIILHNKRKCVWSKFYLLDAALIGLCFSVLRIVEECLNLNNMSPNFSDKYFNINKKH